MGSPAGSVGHRLLFIPVASHLLAPLVGRECRTPACRGSNRTPHPVDTRAEIEWKLQTLTQLPDSAGPVFAFLHLLVPHEPYLFDEQCTAVDSWWPHTDQDESFDVVGRAYAAQVRCLALTHDEMTREQIGERHGVFAANRFPARLTVPPRPKR